MRSRAAVVFALMVTTTDVACQGLLGITAPTPAEDAGDDVAQLQEAAQDVVGEPSVEATAGDVVGSDTGFADAPGADVTRSDTGAPPADGPTGPTYYWTFSDGFESGDFSKWNNAPGQSANGTLSVVHSGAYAGCCALHVTASAGGVAYQYLMETWSSASPALVNGGTMAVRMRIKTTSLDTNSTQLSALQGGFNPTAYASAGLGGSTPSSSVSWGYVYDDPSDGGYGGSTLSAGSDDESSYHCVEFVTNVASAENGGGMAVFADNVLQFHQNLTMTVNVGWDSMSVGLPNSSGNDATDLLVDDVVMSLYTDLSPAAHIGCDDPQDF
jgi:hypothetical protein